MRNRYEELEMEIIAFAAADVIITSVGDDSSSLSIPDENEGPMKKDF